MLKTKESTSRIATHEDVKSFVQSRKLIDTLLFVSASAGKVDDRGRLPRADTLLIDAIHTKDPRFVQVHQSFQYITFNYDFAFMSII
jgi:hypothetical protein